MINISNYIKGETVKNLYAKLTSCIPEDKICCEVYNDLSESWIVPDSYSTVGCHCYDKEKDIHSFLFHKDFLDDVNISHELLHCEMFLQGYPSIILLFPRDHRISLFSEEVNNYLQHRIIYEEQQRLGIDTSRYKKAFAESISNFRETGTIETYLKNSLSVLNAELICGEYRSIYQDVAAQYFPNTYELGKRLYNAAMTADYKSAFEFRKANIRVFMELDSIFDENGVSPLHFHNNVALGLVPSKRQLDLHLSQLFVLKKNVFWYYKNGTKVSILLSIADGQACYYIKENDINTIEYYFNSMTLRQLLEVLGVKQIVTRD